MGEFRHAAWLGLTAAGSSIAACLLVASATLAADPTDAPTASPAVGTVSESLVQTNTRLGELLVIVGLGMVTLVFIALSVAAVFAFVAKNRPQPKPPIAAAGIGDVIGEALKAMPDLIKTPGGIGGLLLILGVVLLLGTAATQSGQLEAFGGSGSTAVPTVNPATASPNVSPTSAAPTASPS